MSGKAIRETLAALGVIASMVFVGLEIQQGNTLARAAAYQELGIAISDDWHDASHNAALNHLYWESERAGDDPEWWAEQSQSDIDLLASLEVGTFRLFEAVYKQVELGLLTDAALESMGWSGMAENGPPHVWPQIRDAMDPYFRDFLEDAWGIAP